MTDTPVTPKSASLKIEGQKPPPPWIAANFARAWFEDALREAQAGDANARRREIVFAVCFLESYLFEWTRNLVGPSEIKTYFPLRRNDRPRRMGIRQKWKDVLKDLLAKKKIARAPAFSGSDWAAFRRLVDYRDGLVHATASRSDSAGLPDEEKPMPSPDDLATMPAGQPVRVVVELVNRLHEATGTTVPPWLMNP